MATRCNENNDTPYHDPHEPVATEERTPDHEQHRENQNGDGSDSQCWDDSRHCRGSTPQDQRILGAPRRLPRQIEPQKFRREYHDAHEGAREAADKQITSDTGSANRPLKTRLQETSKRGDRRRKYGSMARYVVYANEAQNSASPIPTTSIQNSVPASYT